MPIHDIARKLASELHSGQGSALYKFASSGTWEPILCDILSELDACVMELESQPTSEIQQSVLSDIRALQDYFNSVMFTEAKISDTDIALGGWIASSADYDDYWTDQVQNDYMYESD